jgi:hypothetical protein
VLAGDQHQRERALWESLKKECRRSN